MKKLFLLSIILFINLYISLSTSNSLLESNMMTYLANNTIQTFYIALPQRNLNRLESIVMQISDPLSSQYGHYMSQIEIDNLIQTSKKDKMKVREWLESNGVVNITEYGDAFKCETNVLNIEKIFNIEMDILYGNNNYYRFATSDIYTFPSNLQIEFVDGLSLSNEYKYLIENSYIEIFKNFCKYRDNVVDPGLVGRDVFERIYNMNNTLLNNASAGPMEFGGENGFSQKDLVYNEVMNNLPKNPVSDNNIVGTNGHQDGESALDIQMIGQIAANSKLWYEDYKGWMYGWAVDFYNRDRYPQVVSLSWGWNEEEQCNIDKCTNETSKQYVNRTNIEFMKLAAKGVTLVVASGDAGSPGRTNEECDNSNFMKYMNPIFPGSSQWVTSVGATYLVKGNNHYNYSTPICQVVKCATGTTEQGTNFYDTSWTSGAGFDRWTSRPKWQKDVVDEYLHSGVELPTKGYWNREGRAYPDVSAIGHNCLTYLQNEWEGEDGTSCSTPVFAAVLTILNDHQINNGKSVIGFANPLLYQMYRDNPLTFNDVLVGNSSCTEIRCCDNNFGFQATKGWDAVSGLGTPDVGRMIEWLDKNT